MTTIPQTGGALVGTSVPRREDARFLTGRGHYTDDLKVPGLTHAAFVRSPHAHARIRSIDFSRAKSLRGVRAVYTGPDLEKGGVKSIPTAWLLPDIKLVPHPVLATTKVRYVGEPVAIVIADSPYIARDAADLVDVEYEPLDAVVDLTTALSSRTSLHDEAADNRCFHWTFGDAAATDAAFASAARVVKQRVINNRLAAVAIEPRSAIASYEPSTDQLTLWVTSQNPHVHRLIMGAFVLGIPEHRFRVVSPDVGGGFGSKIHVYSEECAVAWASRALGLPIKWTAVRSESFLSDAHGRDHVTEAEIAIDADGKIVGVRARTLANMGAYISLFAPLIPTYFYGPLLGGVYRVPHIHVEVDAVFTNTTPVDAYRGAGRPEACYVIERMVDRAAREIGVDPAEFRRRNYIPADAFPYQSPLYTYDSGNYEPNLDKALELANYRWLREEQERLRGEGRYIGIGIANYIESSGAAPSAAAQSLGGQAPLWESAHVRVHPTGKVTVFTGTHAHGQGHDTAFAQIVADAFGIPIDDVDIVHGDTQQVQFGLGTYGSRSAAVGGSAIVVAAQRLVDKGRKIAAHLLEAAEADVDFTNGRYHVKGSPDRAKTFGEIALAAFMSSNLPAGVEPGFETTTFFDPSNFVFPFGTHIAVVEVARATGNVKVLRYVAVDDVGNVINPMIVDGMVHGGITQGIGQALWENATYDDRGQPLTASLMEYCVPRADQLPSYETDRTVTPSPVNPLGVKGVGEAGTIAATPAVANAVIDALAPFGVTHLDIPLTPPKLWRAMQRAETTRRT